MADVFDRCGRSCSTPRPELRFLLDALHSFEQSEWICIAGHGHSLGVLVTCYLEDTCIEHQTGRDQSHYASDVSYLGDDSEVIGNHENYKFPSLHDLIM